MPNANLIDITGMKFNRLLVLSYYGIYRKRNSWLCRCDCGTETILTGKSIRTGRTKSCGCLKIEKAPLTCKTHGMSKTKEYGAWAEMIKRCYNENYNGCHRYMKRGITVCDEWRNSFETFFKDMGIRPSDNHSLERIDNNKGYSKGNCKWATRIEQANNKERVVFEIFEGELLSRRKLAERIGIAYDSILYHKRKGKSTEEIINHFKNKSLCA